MYANELKKNCLPREPPANTIRDTRSISENAICRFNYNTERTLSVNKRRKFDGVQQQTIKMKRLRAEKYFVFEKLENKIVHHYRSLVEIEEIEKFRRNFIKSDGWISRDRN